MPLPRVIIAAVFFVIGALIAIPALTRSNSSHPSVSAASSTSASPSVSVGGSSPSARPNSGNGSTPKASATTGTHRPTTPSPTVTLSPPATVPLSAAFSTVGCPTREVRVTVTNNGTQTEDYTVIQDGSVVLADRVAPKSSRTNPITLQEGVTSKLSVVWNTRAVRSVSRTATCTTTSPPASGNLPHTGPDSASLYAKIATGIAAMITGVIIFWWGGIWPGRRESMFGDAGRESIQKKGDQVSR